jgi:hypothetical protein
MSFNSNMAGITSRSGTDKPSSAPECMSGFYDKPFSAPEFMSGCYDKPFSALEFMSGFSALEGLS